MENNNNIEFLDMLNIIAFVAQIINMSGDVQQNQYIHQVIQSINEEINKLHKENNIIISQNEEILRLLRN